MNIHEWRVNAMKSYETERYMEHMLLMHEWNEGYSFLPTLTVITMGDLGVAVYQEMMQREVKFNDEGNFIGLSPAWENFQTLAIYGDEDELKRYVVINNGEQRTPDPKTWVPYPPRDDSWKQFAADGHTYDLIGKIIRQ